MIEIIANGVRYTIEAGQTLPEFLASQNQAPERVVVERNGQALTPGETRQTVLKAGDKLEIIRIVAGG